MSYAGFVHLRVHTAYSLSEGAIRIPELIKTCVEREMPAVAITDTDNLFGALEFCLAALNGGVQPIVGCQLSLTAEADRQRLAASTQPDRDTVVLLVQNETGYANLLKLISKSYLETGEMHRPQVAAAVLEFHSEGLICLCGGSQSPVGRLLASGQGEAAEKTLLALAAAFPGRLYLELSRLGDPVAEAIEEALIELAYQYDLPLVATNDAYFLDADMYEAHDALLCIADGNYVTQSSRRRSSPEYRLKTPDEMRVLFADLPEAVDNSVVIARRCAFMVETRAPILPPFSDDNGRDEAEELHDQSFKGLEQRLQSSVFTSDMDAVTREAAAKPYRKRLQYELKVIIEMGFAGYFLIVSEFIRWAKAHDIPVGPGRGSGAGSVAAWSLTITDLDPLQFGLLFERFLNPERVSMPDFDIDFCQNRRDEVIRHVQERYGRDRVAQIITFGKLQARAVLRDVGRVLDMPYSQVDRICKMVPNNPASPVTLRQAVDADPQFKAMIDGDESVKRLFDLSHRLEGLNRHASTHAAGVVIGDRPLDHLIPLYRDPRSDMPVSGFSMKYVEMAGLVKFDFLGLKTLTVLSTAVKLLAKAGVTVDLTRFPLDDAKTFEMLGRADTAGVFQLESAGMRDVLRKLRPDTFEDIIAVVALYRPGPMDNIPSYIRRKHGEEDVDYLYPSLEGILKETFGIMIYQEQVMQIAQELAGYSLGSADLLRRAMGKKIQSEMDEQRQAFVDGSVAKNVPQKQASYIFDLVAKFAGYGFNKSHAAAYALIAYQTAYFKAHYPVEFLAASMTLDINNTDKLNGFRQELQRLDISILPPDINKSEVTFGVERGTAAAGGQGAIRYALAAIKNAGSAAMEAIIAEREKNGPFDDLANFARRVDPRHVNKRLIENLGRAGAFDKQESNRRRVCEAAELIMRHANAAASDRDSNQLGLFNGASAEPPAIMLSAGPDWSPVDRLKEEFDAIGFYLSAHPLDAFAPSLRREGVQSFAQVQASGQSKAVKLAGTVISRKERTSRNGGRFAWLQMSDGSGMYEVMVFSELLAVCCDFLDAGMSLAIKASAQFEGNAIRLTAHQIEPLERLAARSAAGLKVYMDTTDGLASLHLALTGGNVDGRRNGGLVKVISRLDAVTEVEIDLPGRYVISPEIMKAVKAIPGIAEVREL
jgi:DNA polymerase-3 subunit alpha